MAEKVCHGQNNFDGNGSGRAKKNRHKCRETGEERVELPSTVLETVALPLNYSPMQGFCKPALLL